MKKRWLSLLMVLTMLATCLPVGFMTASAEDSTADSNVNSISTIDELTALQGKTLTGNYKLMTDIILTDNWTPIANLTGTFDGNGHSISGLKIENATADLQGMFAEVKGGTVKNLMLKEISISSSNTKVGGVAGRMQFGTISNCIVSGVISSTHEGGSSNVGGVVGEAGGNNSNAVVIEDCINNANITITHQNENDKNVAGIVGQATMRSSADSIIRNCVNNGTIVGVEAASKKVAGIAGEAYFSIVNCYNTGAVSGKADIGGIVGVSYNNTLASNYDTPTYVANCYSTGDITATGNRGGIAGRVNMYSHMVNCYSLANAGLTSGIHTQENASHNYYLSSATAGKTGGTAKPAEDMKTANFARELNNFVIEKKDDEAFAALKMSKWTKGEDGYPVHTGELAGADDVVDTSTMIETAAQLLAINNQSGAYVLANDITITEEDAASVSAEYLVNAFRGTLNGDGKTVTIDCNKMLMQYLYGSINNLKVQGNLNLPDIGKVAPFARYCYAGSLTNCSFDGSVTAKDYPSGIVSNVFSGSTIDGCSTTATSTVTAIATSGFHYAAGIVSTASSWENHDGDIVIRNCINKATITAGNDFCGGVVGYVNGGTVVVDACTNEGTIAGKNATAGIVAAGEGKATLIITNCQNNASISGGNYVGGIVGRTQENLTLYVVNNSSVGSMNGTTGGVVQTIRGNVVAYLENNYSYNKQNMVAFSTSGDTAKITVNNTFAWWNAAGMDALGYQHILESTMKSAGFVLTLDSYIPSAEVKSVLTEKQIVLKTWDVVENATPVLGTVALGSKGGIKYDGETLLVGNDLQLQYFAAQVGSNATLSARLTADIALTENWAQISTSYAGTFDGNGYTISGFKQKDLTSGNVGMFKELAATGTIKNLTMIGHIDCPAAENFGAIVATNNGLVYGCTNKVNIVDEQISRDETGYLTTEGGKAQIGGLVGVNNGTIDSCVNEGIVTAFKDNAGGIAGQGNNNSLIVNCRNEGEIAHVPGRDRDTGGSGTGGILGGTENDNVTAYAINCYNTGKVYDNNQHRGYIGGIVGDRGFAYNCYNNGTVWYKGNAGGGYGISGRQNAGTLEHCFSGYATNKDKNNGTIMTIDALKEANFASTLNDGVKDIAGDYLAIVTSKNVTLSNWSQGEDQLPTFGMTVQFYGKSNILLAAKSVLSVSQLKQVLDATKAPALGGYAFESWDTEITDMDELWATGISGKLTLTARYVKSPTAKDYTITVVDATATNGADDPVTSGETKLAFDDRVTVTAASADGETFSYWLLDGAKVGFGETSYTFYVSGSNTITAVFDATETQTPEVVLQQATYATDSEGQYTLSVIAQTSIPAGYTVESYGVYYTGAASVMKALAENAETVDTTKYVQVVSSKKGAGEQYMTHLMNVGAGKTRYARAYAVVKDAAGEQQILWSTAVYQFKTTTDGVTIVKGVI